MERPRFLLYPLNSFPPSYSPVLKRTKYAAEHTIPAPEPGLLGRKLWEKMRCESASPYADITLICTDGTRLAAVRMILALSSSYFEKLLTSDFAEKNCSEISLNMSSRMLLEILEFIYTDDCPLFHLIRSGDHDSVVLCDTMRHLIGLAFEADYLCMERLLSRCQKALKYLCMAYPHLSTLVIQAMRTHNSTTWCQQTYQGALATCGWYFSTALLRKIDRCDVSCGVLHLDTQAAEDVFSFMIRSNKISNSQIFLALVIWASGGSAKERIVETTLQDGFKFLTGSKIGILDSRREAAKKIAGWFNLTCYKPEFLSDVVEASGLAEPAAINDAYKKLSFRYGHRLFGACDPNDFSS